MKNRKTYSISIAVLAAIVAFSCSKDLTSPELRLMLPDQAFDYTSTQDVPQSSGYNSSAPNAVETTDEGATLGRVLFYDKRLSVSNKTACASCHKQHLGFADSKKKSDGFFINEAVRNSPGLANMRHHNDYFWDSRESSLTDLVLQPITDHIEMGVNDFDLLIEKLSGLAYYPSLFEAAFGDETINDERIASALAQFVGCMTSYNSRYDLGVVNEFAQFSPSELQGRELFFDKLPCGGCHFGADLGGQASANIGLDLDYEDGGITLTSSSGTEFANTGIFRTPSLRNVALTAPYMHDGRFETLEEVVHHYASDIENHEYLSFILRFGVGWGGSGDSDLSIPQEIGDPVKFALTDNDVDDIVSFLRTLTDEDLMVDSRFSDPFVEVE